MGRGGGGRGGPIRGWSGGGEVASFGLVGTCWVWGM